MGSCKVKLGKVTVILTRGTNDDGEDVPFVEARISGKLKIGNKIQHPIVLGEADQRFKVDEMSLEAQEAIQLVEAEIEAKVRAKFEAKAAEMAKDAGLTLEK